ncbi:MAG: hypothetical protein ACTH31_05285 [Pseudoclavibacter sp.]
MKNLRSAAIVGAAALMLLLSGCSSNSQPLGTAQELEVSDDATSATLAITVTSVEQESIDFLDGYNLDADEAAMTPYLVHYEVELVDGSIDEEFSLTPVMSFGDEPVLGAKDADGGDAISMQLIAGVNSGAEDSPGDRCSGPGEALQALAVGESATGCRVFLAESDAGLSEVTIGDLAWGVQE